MIRKFDIVEIVLLSGMAVFLATALVLIAVYLPLTVIAESECLKAGYPEARVTVSLDRYCVKLDGDARHVVVPSAEVTK